MPRVGDRVDENGFAYVVTSVTPILTKGRADGHVVEVKVEGYSLGLKLVGFAPDDDEYKHG